jgi:hypothetical protein
MEPILCPETSVRNCHYSLRNITVERSSQCGANIYSALVGVLYKIMSSWPGNGQDKVFRIVYGARWGCQSGGHKNSCYKVCVPCHVRAVVEETFHNYGKIFPLRDV